MSTIPSDIDEVYEELKTEIIWLHGRWSVYTQLFTGPDKRIDLLDKCAGTFFYILQDLLAGELQVSLSKLTDPARSMGNDNLSLEQLQERVKAHAEPELAGRLRQLLDELRSKCQPFRKWRDKRRAHLDLPTSIRSNPNPLPDISQEMVEDALALVREYMNGIEVHYHDGEVAYDHIIMTASDGDALVLMLKYGPRYEELVKAESIPFDDWQRGKWHDA